MRISIFSAFYPFRGGIAQFNACLYRALEKTHVVRAFTFTTQYPSFLFPGKTQLVTADDRADAIPATRIVNGFNPLTYSRAASVIRKSDPELLIVNYWMSFFGYCLAALGKGQASTTRRIAILHNLIPHERRFFDAFLIKRFIRQYDGFVTLSHAVDRDLKSLLPHAKTLCIPHPWYNQFGEAMDKTQARQQLQVSPSLKTLLFFGLIRDYKGLDILLETMSLLDESYQLIIAGEVYGSAAPYEGLIEKSPARSRIYFFNQYICDEEVKKFFSAADICILPYRSGTQSGVIAVSYQFEVPVVVTDVGGLKEIVQESNGGVVVPHTTAHDLQKGIEAATQPANLQAYRESIAKAKATNSWDEFARRVVAFGETLR